MFPAEPIPDTIGPYKVVRRLPGAGAAEIYLAKAQGPMGFERECELKLMPDTSDGDVSYAEQLAREAAICARLNNPAVVRVFDFFEHQGKLVLALEHVDGVSLAELLPSSGPEGQKLGDAAIFHVGARIAGAIGDAHAAKDEQGQPTPIIHRNISPETVLVSAEGDVRLTGFGVGKILGRTPDTAIGRIKGTPGYMAPEQARGEPATTKADVYGLGLLLWSLLAGRRPPTDGTWPRRITGLRNDLPREVAALVDAALDHFPGTRKITAREIEQWLSKAAPAAKGKAELRQRVASLRAAKDPEAPPPSSRRRISAVGTPYTGVSFGPARKPSPPGGTPAAARVQGPAKHGSGMMAAVAQRPSYEAGNAAAARTPTVTGVGKVSLNLPPPPPAEELTRPNALPVRFGPPPADVAAVVAAPIAPPPPAASFFTPEPAPASGLLAPVLPLAPAPAAPATPAPAVVRFGTPPPPPMASPAPAPVAMLPAPHAAPPPAPPAPLFLPDPPPRRPPLPSLLTIGPGRRSLSTFGGIVVSAMTATVVVSVALYAFARRDRTPPVSSASAAIAAPAPPPPAPAPSAAPAPTVAASADPALLPLGYGYLTVVAEANANVYISGKLAGPVNKPIRMRCGRWFIRLATPQEGRYPEWVTTGETVIVPCQESTRLEMSPHRP